MLNPPPVVLKKRPAPLSIRFNTREMEELRRLAGDQPIGRYIKDCLFQATQLRRTTPSPLQDKKLLAQILGALGQSRIASNINQLAKAANSGSLPVNDDMIKALLEAVEFIRWMRGMLINGMGLKAHSQPDKEPPHDP